MATKYRTIRTQEELINYFKKEIGNFYTSETIKNIIFDFPKDKLGIITPDVFCKDFPNLNFFSFENCTFNNVVFEDISSEHVDCLLFKDCNITAHFGNCNIYKAISFTNCKLSSLTNLTKSYRKYNSIFMKNCLTCNLILDSCDYSEESLLLSRNYITKIRIYDSNGFFKLRKEKQINKVKGGAILFFKNVIDSLYLKEEEGKYIYSDIKESLRGKIKYIITEDSTNFSRRYSVFYHDIPYYTKKKSCEPISFNSYGILSTYEILEEEELVSVYYNEYTNTITIDRDEYDYYDFKSKLNSSSKDNRNNNIRGNFKLLRFIHSAIENTMYNHEEYQRLVDIYRNRGYLVRENLTREEREVDGVEREREEIEIEEEISPEEERELKDRIVIEIEQLYEEYRLWYFDNYLKPKLLLFCNYIERNIDINNNIMF